MAHRAGGTGLGASMNRFLAGLVAAVAAGACLGLTSDWVSSSGGWDEMHLGARGAAWFAAAADLPGSPRRSITDR
jgi:hypothetical protein